MTSGACKGRMQVMGMTYMGGPLCLDNMAQAKSMAAMEMANPRPALGMVYTGLAVAASNSPCAGNFVVSGLIVNGQSVCTHGPDPGPANVPSLAGVTPIPAGQDIAAPVVETDSGSLPTTPVSGSAIDNSVSASTDNAETVSASKSTPVKVVFAVQKPTVKALTQVKLTAATTPSTLFSRSNESIQNNHKLRRHINLRAIYNHAQDDVCLHLRQGALV